MSLSSNNFLLICVIFSTFALYVQGQFYEDSRCKCVCTIKNGTRLYKQQRVTPVPPNNDCDQVVDPIEEKVGNKTKELCPRCECTYESRSTAIIKIAVIMVIWVISLLVIYMLFLICLDPLLNKRVKGNYVEHTNDDDEVSTSSQAAISSSHQMGVRGGNVLNRMGHQQDKWKKQVLEQRKNIYDRHTMLN